jgi:hypothetical protein
VRQRAARGPFPGVFRRRWLIYPIPGLLVAVWVTAASNSSITPSSLLWFGVATVASSAMFALVLKTRTSARPTTRTATSATELGEADPDADAEWSWQAMTRRLSAGGTGEQLAEVVWDGREFFVDSTHDRPGDADVLAYCLDVVVTDPPEVCLEHLAGLVADVRSWSSSPREGCPYTVEGLLAAVNDACADVILRARVDRIDSSGGSRVRVVLTAGPVPGDASAQLTRYATKLDPLISLPRAARAAVTALGLDDRYARTAEANADVVDSALLGLVGVRALDEFADGTLFIHRERLAASGASTLSRVLRRVVLSLLGLVGLFLLAISIVAALM